MLVEHGHADATPPLVHLLDDLPLAVGRIVRVAHLDAGDGVAATPAADREQHLDEQERLARLGARALHGRAAQRQQVVVLGLVDQVAAHLVLLDQRVVAYLVRDETGH